MQNHDWIELFRLIPENQHNILVLTTLSGVDLNIETIMRTDLDYLVFRGRVSGTIDEGRVFFLPYRQIDFLQINRAMKETEIREMFGEAVGPKSGFHSGSGTVVGGSVISAPKSGLPSAAPSSFPGVAAAGGSGRSAVLPRSGAAPTVAGRVTNVPPAALQPPPPGAIPNIPAAALVPPAAPPANAQPRNSILERLRAQRNAVLPPRPPTR